MIYMNYSFTIRILFLIVLFLVMFTFSCTSVQRLYMDNIDTTYKTVRTFGEKIGTLIDLNKANYTDTSIPGPLGEIPVRIYIPKKIRKEAPLVMYMHGGGFVIGSYAQKHSVTNKMADRSQCIIVSVDYALAPEHPYPAGLMDCLAVYDYLVENARYFRSDPKRIVVAGDSAGAALAAVICQFQRDHNQQIPLAQMLFSPAAGEKNPETGEIWPSRLENAKKSFLTKRSLEIFFDFYLQGKVKENENNPYVYPLYAKTFENLPQAMISLCGKDPLLDEGKAYGESLIKQGIRTDIILLKNKDHNYQGRNVIIFASDFLNSL